MDRRRRLRSWLWLLPLLSGYVEAQQRIEVVDQNGSALSHVVVEWPGSVALRSAPATMDQRNKTFVPHVLSIVRGEYVDFPNSDNIRHHVYSFSETKPFEIKLYRNRGAEAVHFDRSGVVVLGCNIHDSMVGYIYVADGVSRLTDSRGLVSVPQDIKLEQLSFWHPRQQQGLDRRINWRELTSQARTDGWRISLNVQAPEPRNSFEDVFSGASQ